MLYKVYLSFLFLAVYACGFSAIRAEDAVSPATDIFAGIQPGDDLQITLKNKNIFKGTVEDISDSSIKIDISNFDEKMTGFIVLNKSQIKKIKQLKALTEKDIESIESKRTLFKEKYSGNLPVVSAKKDNTADESAKDSKTLLEKFPPDKGWGKEKYNDLLQLAEGKLTDEEKEFLEKYEDWVLEKKQAEDKKSDDLLKKFPPDKGWGQDKYDSLSLQFATVGTSLTGEEQEFVDKFENWKKAKETADSSKVEETAAENTAKSAESQPQPAPAAEKPKTQPKTETKPDSQPAPDKTKKSSPPSDKPKTKPKSTTEPTKSPGPPPLQPPQAPPPQPQPGQQSGSGQ
ncbi:MAG: hypothetical protein HZA48_01455 [Planctomycetes bacterium]|nr:hypothetical protein [Planctomycetota bacterium]